MDALPAEMKYVLIMAAIVLVQYLFKRFAAPPADQSGRPHEPAAQDAELPGDIPWAAVDAGAAPAHFGRTGSQDALIRPARRRFARHSLIGTRRKTQDAVVIATILGPCRAFESPDQR